MVRHEFIESSVLRDPLTSIIDLKLGSYWLLLPDIPFQAKLQGEWWFEHYAVLAFDQDEARKIDERLSVLLLSEPESLEVIDLVERLKVLSGKILGKEPHQWWRRIAYIMPHDMGGGAEARERITDYLSRRYTGNILEAMAGYHTYFHGSPRRTMTALDYCKEALLRYPGPGATRILCDLDEASEYNHLECFEESFDVISICFGFRYLKDPVQVMKELARHLKPQGKISFIENPALGYRRLCLRVFSPQDCREALETAGLNVRCLRLPFSLGELTDDGKDPWYYHVEATR